jgi:acetolactate synthase-1/2/3 large subunit
VSTPNFELIAKAFGIEYQPISGRNISSKEWKEKLTNRTPTLFEVFISPNQMFYPRIESKVQPNGHMVSNSLHEMYPEMESKKADLVSRFLMETEENHE